MKIIGSLLASVMLLGATPALAQSTAGAKGPSGAALQPAPPAGGVADPVAWVRSAYTGSDVGALSGADRYSREPVFSERLRGLFADDESYAQGEVGRLGFNPFTGAQDDDIKQVAIAEHAVDGAADRKVVVARFQNMNVRQVMTFYFERTGGRWYIDDIAGRTVSKEAEPGWVLSHILKYGIHGE